MYKGKNTFIDVREALFPLYCIVLSTFMEERDNEQKKKWREAKVARGAKRKKKTCRFYDYYYSFFRKNEKKHILCRSSFITLSLPVIPGSEIDSESGQTFSS